MENHWIVLYVSANANSSDLYESHGRWTEIPHSEKGFQEAKKSLEYLALMNDREIPKENEYKFEDEVKCQEMQGNFAKLLHYENQDIFCDRIIILSFIIP